MGLVWRLLFMAFYGLPTVLLAWTGGAEMCYSNWGEDSLGTTGFDIALSATSSANIYVPGDRVDLKIVVSNEGSIPANRLNIYTVLPPGLVIDDPNWPREGEGFAFVFDTLSLLADKSTTVNLSCRVGEQAGPGNYKLEVQISSAENEQGVADTDSQPGTLRLDANKLQDDEQILDLTVAEVLKTVTDTCANLQDTFLRGARSFLSTQQRITYRLASPIDLSPSGPLRLSSKKCAAFKLKPLDQNDEQGKCTCFTLEFTGENGVNYPDPYPANGELVKTCIPISSAGGTGDTIRVTVRSIDGNPIKRVLITDSDGLAIDGAFDVASFIFQDTLTDASQTYRLLLQTGKKFIFFPKRQPVFVEVLRLPKAVTTTRATSPSDSLITPMVLSNEPLLAGKDSSRFSKVMAISTSGGQVLAHIVETYDTLGQLLLSDTLSRDTCLGMFSIQTESATQDSFWVPVDTLLAEAMDQELSLAGKRNLFGQRRGYLEVKIPMRLDLVESPARDTLLAIAYWIGIGEPPLSAYLALAEEVPKEWAQPGVSAPLAAYAVGHPIVLPQLKPSENIFRQNFVQYDFVDEYEKDYFFAGKGYHRLFKRSSTNPNFGIIQGEKLTTLLSSLKPSLDDELGKPAINFFLILENKHEVNSYRINLKIIGLYKTEKKQARWRALR